MAIAPKVARVRTGGARRVTLQGSNWTSRPPAPTAWQSERAYGCLTETSEPGWRGFAAKASLAVIAVIGWTAVFAWILG